MTLQQLIYFQKIATLQHYNKAAKELHVAQPSLSKSMALLEDELQIPLFEKQGRNIILTKYGKVFLEHVQVILEEITQAQNHVHAMLDRHIGHINVAYISPFGHQYIPKMVRKFLNREENHQVTFTFKEGFTGNMIKSIHDGDMDVIFGSYEKNEESLEFFELLNEELILIAHPRFQIEQGRIYNLKDFERQPFIAYDSASNMGKQTREIFERENCSMHITCESSDEISILSLVSNEFGLSYIAKTSEVKLALERGEIKEIPIRQKEKRTLYMIYDKSKFLSPAVLDFIQFIKDECALEKMGD